jgi:hypothetical protein
MPVPIGWDPAFRWNAAYGRVSTPLQNRTTDFLVVYLAGIDVTVLYVCHCKSSLSDFVRAYMFLILLLWLPNSLQTGCSVALSQVKPTLLCIT